MSFRMNECRGFGSADTVGNTEFEQDASTGVSARMIHCRQGFDDIGGDQWTCTDELYVPLASCCEHMDQAASHGRYPPSEHNTVQTPAVAGSLGRTVVQL